MAPGCQCVKVAVCHGAWARFLARSDGSDPGEREAEPASEPDEAWALGVPACPRRNATTVDGHYAVNGETRGPQEVLCAFCGQADRRDGNKPRVAFDAVGTGSSEAI